MMNIRFSKTNLRVVVWAIFLLFAIGTTACGGAQEAPLMDSASVAEEAYVDVEVVGESEKGYDVATVDDGVVIDLQETSSTTASAPGSTKRLIIKNAELELVVEDTDIAIDRSLGIVTEYNGYVVSNRTWLSHEEKYATLAIGVPSENFEEMLRRLKDISVEVTNEMVSGQDVTDEFVDLESRLRNLETTANRVRTFMEQAETVEESLAVSVQLSELDGQIEQIKGRMNYLQDRASFSNITIQFVPEAAHNPLVAAIPWTPSQSVERAIILTGSIASTLYRVGIEMIVLFVIVILPFLLPLVVLIWGGIRMVRWLGMRKVAA